MIVADLLLASAHLQEPMYVHVICGVNHNVSGPEYCYDTGTPVSIYQHTPVNFLASRRDGNPELFFAELSNDEAEDGGGKVLCCPVNFPQPRQGISLKRPLSFSFQVLMLTSSDEIQIFLNKIGTYLGLRFGKV